MNEDIKNRILEAFYTSCEKIGSEAKIEYVFMAVVGDNDCTITSRTVHKSNAEKYDDKYVGLMLGSLAMMYLDMADSKKLN